MPLGGFREKIALGAFDKSLKQNTDIRLLNGHDWNKPMARTTAGTLSVSVDNIGVRYEATVDPGISYVNNLIRSVDRGDITGTSFGFNVDDSDGDGDSWDSDDDGNVIRTLKRVNLSELSIVSSPAYVFDSAVSLRSCPAELRSLLDIFDDDDSDNDDDCTCDPDDPDCKCHKDEDRSIHAPDFAALAVVLAHKRMTF